MSLKRGRVFGGLVFSLVLISAVEAQAQGNSENRGHRIGATTLSFESDWGGLSALRTYVTALIAQLEQSRSKIAQLEAALNNEISARQAADTALQNAINGVSAGVTQAALNAAIAAEANTRSTADAALEGQIANEAAAIDALGVTVTALSDTVAPLAALMPLAPLATYVSVNTATINGLAGPHIIFTGVNVHVRSGHASGESLVANGRGNLVIGYNEPSGYTPTERGGSHNVVVGASHRYNFGTGFVVGYGSRLGGMGASVNGGAYNDAGGEFSSVSAGRFNLASGFYSSVSGGDSNIASGNTAAVSAGLENTASGDLSSVSGGISNEASGYISTVGGGSNLNNSGMFTFIP